ncbi:hypothetical protein [Streptomyces violens]|uniref:hypothetical protein n=1 Tax=Streptomyces violens TaxID=66377 RepID=UPI00068D9E81|nr:hypothetical protein [Streptomyces violens]
MSDAAWSVPLSAKARQELRELPDHGQQMARDALDIDTRSPWGWHQWDRSDPERQDVRCASICPLSLNYWINRPAQHLSVLAITWLEGIRLRQQELVGALIGN